MENTIRFIINADGTHKVSNRGILRALSQYDTKLYIITPLPLETSIRVNYLIHERHDIRTQQYLTPVVNMKGCDLVSELESIYQEVADWNVFGCSINPLAYSKISKYRSGRIGISFTISQVLNVEGNPNLTNYKGLIGSNGDIPSGTYQNGDYFECDTFNFFSQTLNKRLTQGSIAYFKDNAWHELERFEVIKNTTTENVAVDPACLAETPPATEETINEIIANYTGAVAETVDKVNYLDTAVQELDNKKLNKIWADITEQTTTNLTDILVFNRGSNVYKTTVANLLEHVAVVELFTVVAELPEVGLPNKIYLVPSSEPEIQNILNEFIWVNNAWERIGGISVDLSNYFNKPEIISMLGGKQDKLVAGDNITIDENNNVISVEVDLNEMSYFNYAGSIYGGKYSLLANAWEHSLTVDPLEISADSSIKSPRGTAQYPNGEIEGVIIPQGVTSIGNNAFYNWNSNNKPLVIPNSVTSIGISAFYNWRANNHPLIIPNSVTSIGISAFMSWSLVPYVEIQATIPPTLVSADAFSNQNNAPIYVPDESVDDYKTATNWVDLADRIFPMSDNLTDLIGVVNDVIYQSDTHVITFKRNEMPDIVIDLPIEALVSNVSLDGDDLVLAFENGDTVRVPLNTLLVGVVKQVNGINADNNGVVNLTIDDIPNLRTTLISKLDITTYTNDINNLDTRLDNVESGKQDKLISGENITIEDNVIHAVGVYEPDNITIGLNAEQKLEVKDNLEIDGGDL